MEHLYLNNKRHCINCSHRTVNKWHCDACDRNCMHISQCPVDRFDNDANWFPVLIPVCHREYNKVVYIVPFDMIKEHENQCLINHGQSVERLKERGGLSWDEMWAVVHDIHYRDSEYQAVDEARIPMIHYAEEWGKEKGIIQEDEYLVPVEWVMTSFIKVKANSPEEALKEACIIACDIPIPEVKEAEYLEDSFRILDMDDKEACLAIIKSYTDLYRKKRNIPILE